MTHLKSTRQFVYLVDVSQEDMIPACSSCVSRTHERTILAVSQELF